MSFAMASKNFTPPPTNKLAVRPAEATPTMGDVYASIEQTLLPQW